MGSKPTNKPKITPERIGEARAWTNDPLVQRERHLHALRMIVAAAPNDKAHVAREELRKAVSSPASESQKGSGPVPGATSVQADEGTLASSPASRPSA